MEKEGEYSCAAEPEIRKGVIMKIRIAENIRNLRKEHAFTQEQMAEALGVTVGAVYKWEAGLSMPEIKLIMEIADLFEVSVDMLLGYVQQSGNVENRIQRMKQCIVEKDFEEGVSESEKALKKYPNNFDVVYASAMMYMLKFSEDKCEESMIKSNHLFEKAISLLYQHTDKRINEQTIMNHIASNYLAAGKTEQGLEILKQNNICSINSSHIGYIYAVERKNLEDAKPYLFSSLAGILNQMLLTVVGRAFGYAQARDEKCVSTALWLADFFDSLKEESGDIIFLDKLKAILLAQCAVWKKSFGHPDEAREYITMAYELAKQFDETPVYTMHGVKFFDGMESEGVSFDGIGKTAMEAVEKFVFDKKNDFDAQKQVKEQWEELKNGCRDAESEARKDV